MVDESEMKRVEESIEEEFKKISMDMIVNEAKLVSPEVIRIMWHDAALSQGSEVEYTTSTNKYIAKFSSAALKLDDGNEGVVADVPDESEADMFSSMTFIVVGFHHGRETSVQLTEHTVFVTPSMEHKHVMDFQRAVLNKGSPQKSD